MRTLPRRGAAMLGTHLAREGERRGWDALTYNPLQMLAYHEMALADAPTVMAALRAVFPEARTVLDVGAGSGAYAAAGRRLGLDVEACERSWGGRLLARSQGVSVHRFDLLDESSLDLGRRFDLAYCFEVAEHLPPELGDRLVEVLASLSDVIVFTAAHPGQGGLGHVNEQERAYWVQRFRRWGMDEADAPTARLRAELAGAAAPWFAANAIVLTRATGPTGTPARTPPTGA